MSAGKIRIGVGGWSYGPWKGVFFPKGTPSREELAYASRRLSSIEINSTFYRTQSPAVFEKWFSDTPDDFVFAVKAPRYATNRRVLAEAGDSIGHFLASGVKNLKHKLGPINWQFADTKKFDPDDFEAFLTLLPPDFKHAVEVRHDSFKCEEFVALANRYEVAVVFSGDSEHPLIPDVTASFVYARIMGTKETEEHGYSGAQLDAWANRVRGLASGLPAPDLPAVSSTPPKQASRDVFLYVIGGFKQANPSAAMALIERIR